MCPILLKRKDITSLVRVTRILYTEERETEGVTEAPSYIVFLTGIQTEPKDSREEEQDRKVKLVPGYKGI